jgi:hypothetical protein
MLLQIPSVEFTLLVVEVLLLLVTLFVVILTMREARHRGALLNQMIQTASTVSRQEYFTTVVEGIQAAEKTLWGIVTGSKPEEREYDTIETIIEQLLAATSKEVEVRYLLPVNPDRLHMASRYKAAGAEVRFHPALVISDLRYMIVDDKLVVVGLPRRTGQDEPTRKGYKIPSERMTRILREDFEKYWESHDAVEYRTYLLRIIRDSREGHPSLSDQLLADQLGITVKEIQRMNSSKKDAS